MKRRNYSGEAYLLPLCLILIVFILFSCGSPVPKDSEEQENEGWILHNDGSFDFTYGKISLNNCYPGIDNHSIRPLRVKVKRQEGGGRLEYHLEQGVIEIILGQEDGFYTINCRLKFFSEIPGGVYPVSEATVTGADRFYKQGFGFAGPSGIFPFPEPKKRIELARLKEDVWSYDSYLFTGLLKGEGQSMVLSAYDFSNYMHRSTLSNRQTRFGLIDRHLDNNTIAFKTGFELEGIGSGKEVTELPEIVINTGDQAFDVFREQAQKIADMNRISVRHSPRYYYCSWYEFRKDFSEEILKDMLEGISKMDDNPGYQSIQIDDGYSWYGDWLNVNDRFPGGLEKQASMIIENGFQPGIWVGPFMVSSNSFIFSDHKDWLLKDKKGEIIVEGKRENEDLYILDSSHPDALEYLRTVFRTFRQMGFTSYKTDFMDWGLQDSRKVQRFTPGKTSMQYFREVLEMIRNEIGDESYWLGCISPYQPMLGFVDGFRVSNDVGERWARETTGNMLREMYAGQFFNQIFWQNDPDVLYLRDYSSQLTESEKYTIALFDGMMGGTLTSSCRYNTLKKEDRELWQFLKPGVNGKAGRLPYWDQDSEILVVARDYPGENACSVFFVNISEEQKEKSIDLKYITGLDEGFKVFKWFPAKASEVRDIRSVSLAPHESVLFYVSGSGEPPHPERNLY